MKKFSVPCLLAGKIVLQHSVFVGEPNHVFDPSEFQALWLLHRRVVLDKTFRRWLKDMHLFAVKHQLEFQTACAEAADSTNAVITESKRLQYDEQMIAGVSKPLHIDVSFSTRSRKHTTNMLVRFWSNEFQEDEVDSRAKDRVVEHVSTLILSAAANPSKIARNLLLFLISFERASISSVFREWIEAWELVDLTYNLAVKADTDGKSMSHDVLVGFREFMQIAEGDQLLAIVELRNIIEQWALSPESDKDLIYDLTEFRADLREYFLPQQWKENKRPTAQDMYSLALELRTGKNGVKSLLGEIAWTLRAAHAGDITAQCAIGYYFGKLGDKYRYLYWTKKSAESGLPQAIYNLGSSYVNGSDGLRKHRSIGLKYLMNAARLRHPNAMAEIGWTYIQLGDYKRAKLWLDKAVRFNQDDNYAYSYLGRLYEKGWGVPKSKAVALGYYIIAGDMGHKYAQNAAQKLRGQPIVFGSHGAETDCSLSSEQNAESTIY